MDITIESAGHTRIIDLDEYDDQGTFLDDVRKWLGSLEVEGDEWGVVEWDDKLDDDLLITPEGKLSDAFWVYKDAVDEDDIPRGVIYAGIELQIPPEDIEECYKGEYSSMEAYAKEVTYTPPGRTLPVDWSQIAFDIEQSGDVIEGGRYYFRSY